MKVIFVISAMNGGGAERVLATLANRYVRRGDQVTILMVAGDESAYPLDERVTILSIGQPSHGNPLVQLKRLFAMRRYFKQHREWKIVSFGTEINLFTILAALGLKNRVIVSERNDPNRCGYPAIRNFVYSLCKGFVFQTEDARGCFSKKIQKNSVVIPNPICKELPEPMKGLTKECGFEREKRIAVVGRLENQKNHSLLLQAFAGFHKSFPEWELHIFGKGRLEQALRQEADELGVLKQVVFEGFRSDILETIRPYGMYVLSSDYEGISNSLMEAMAMGIPCVSTDCPIGGSALCIQNGENGLLVPVGDAGALQAAMERIAADEQLAERLGKNGVAVRDTFAEEVIADKWRKYIDGAVSV